MKREKITDAELEVLKRIRAGGIPFAVIAAELGVERTLVWKWMNGQRRPGYLTTDRIRRFIRKHSLAEIEAGIEGKGA